MRVYFRQGAIGNIRNESEESVRCARALLEKTKEETAADLESLERDYEELERKVLERANECEVLVKFKVSVTLSTFLTCLSYLKTSSVCIL